MQTQLFMIRVTKCRNPMEAHPDKLKGRFVQIHWNGERGVIFDIVPKGHSADVFFANPDAYHALKELTGRFPLYSFEVVPFLEQLT